MDWGMLWGWRSDLKYGCYSILLAVGLSWGFHFNISFKRFIASGEALGIYSAMLVGLKVGKLKPMLEAS